MGQRGGTFGLVKECFDALRANKQEEKLAKVMYTLNQEEVPRRIQAELSINQSKEGMDRT